MKKAVALALAMLLLTGCSSGHQAIDRALDLRGRLLGGSGCSFTAKITADHGDSVQYFTVDCKGDDRGELEFTVKSPETIAGIQGSISEDGGKLTFDDVALAFPLLTQEQISPVSAPWIFLRTLRGGYLTSAGEDDGLLRVTIDDTYEEDALQLDIWLNGENMPVRAEILYDGVRILSLEVEQFQIL